MDDEIRALLDEQVRLLGLLKQNLSDADYELVLDLAAVSETIGEYE
jgi:hypothetical protein